MRLGSGCIDTVYLTTLLSSRTSHSRILARTAKYHLYFSLNVPNLLINHLMDITLYFDNCVVSEKCCLIIEIFGVLVDERRTQGLLDPNAGNLPA